LAEQQKERIMLTVTEAAKQRLRETLLVNTDDREDGLRLKIKSPGQLGLVLDRQSPTDNVIEHEGLKVLLVQPEVYELLRKATLDVQKSSDGTKLTIFQE
jgi:Fe-S cluster assembly iron-binding protein IscA